VEDPNQIAFLFPSLKTGKAQMMKKALEETGLKVYAPRAGKFLNVEEARAMFGLFLQIIGKPVREDFGGAYSEYHDWLESAMAYAKELMNQDGKLALFVEHKKKEIMQSKEDYQRLLETVQKHAWELNDPYEPSVHKPILLNTEGISEKTKKGLDSPFLDRIIEERKNDGKPIFLHYILNRATALDWSILDLFYRLCGFSHFAQMFKLAEEGTDEGPICNLSMISDYLARFMEQSGSVITGESLQEDQLVNQFFGRFVYGLFRLEESEYEDKETPFPKGRIPFLTIHQSKGLEFPYVVLGTLEKRRVLPRNEAIIRSVITEDAEPLERVPEFDAMRLFYVALSRAEKMLILVNAKGMRSLPAFKQLLKEEEFPTLPEVNISKLPFVPLKHEELPKVYSYTGDYLLYLSCPRNYMVFKKYGFVPSRSQTMFFGTLVHKTIEDLHNRIIALRERRNP
jgi:DNA helicase II / ATP-dependent DNA helicase PcrA